MTENALPDMNADAWNERSSHEAGFWHQWIRNGGGKWPKDYERRADPNTPLIRPLQNLLHNLRRDPNETAHILDIGSGPLSVCGYTCPGREIELTLVDPLADEYNRTLDAKGVTGVPRPIKGFFETALDQLGNNRFDIVWCRNSLDHSLDPVLGLHGLINMCKIGGALQLSFHPNEAAREGYVGLHQWNLDERDGQLFVSQKDHEINLSQMLAQQRVISVYRAPDVDKEKGEITIIVQKLRDCNLTQSLMGKVS